MEGTRKPRPSRQALIFFFQPPIASVLDAVIAVAVVKSDVVAELAGDKVFACHFEYAIARAFVKGVDMLGPDVSAAGTPPPVAYAEFPFKFFHG